jgi:hypothetical protein
VTASFKLLYNRVCLPRGKLLLLYIWCTGHLFASHPVSNSVGMLQRFRHGSSACAITYAFVVHAI